MKLNLVEVKKDGDRVLARFVKSEKSEELVNEANERECKTWKKSLRIVLREVVDDFNSRHPRSFSGYRYNIADSIANELYHVLASEDCRAFRELAAELEVPIQFKNYCRVSGTKYWRGWCLYASVKVVIGDAADCCNDCCNIAHTSDNVNTSDNVASDNVKVLVEFQEAKTKSGYDHASSPELEIRNSGNFHLYLCCDDAKKYVKDVERLKLLMKVHFVASKAIAVVKARGKRYIVFAIEEDGVKKPYRPYVFEVEGRAGRKGGKYLVDIAGKTLWRTDKTLLSRKYIEDLPVEVRKKILELLV